MKKSVIVLLLTIVYGFIASSLVSAHVLQSNGTVGAVLHIDPEDDPIIGQPSGFYFEFKDTQNKFQLSECVCTFSVKQNGKQVFTEQLGSRDENQLQAQVTYTFPKKNVYTITVTGQPRTEGAFTSFTLAYNLRVDKEMTATTGERSWVRRHLPHIIGAGIIIVFLLLYGMQALLQQRKGVKK